MLFVSLTFLFLFLPLVLIIYYTLKKKRNIQNVFLFLVSLFFYAWGEPRFVIILVISIFMNWYLAMIIDKRRDNSLKNIVVVIAVVLNIGVLFVYKYLNFVLSQANRLGVHLPLKDIALPIGISFFTFQALSYVIDVYRGEKCQKSPLYVGLYISFFPQLIAGPIVRYKTVAEQIDERVESFELFRSGVIRFMQGFSKKVLLANTMAVIADKAFSIVGAELTISFAWLGAVAYMLQIYFDFSGYSDMAIGLGRMFGFEFEENFNCPYTANSITDFWRRWHISLSSWFRDYVYIPLGGNRTGSSFRNYFNLFVVWLLTGIWHGANWTFIVWGLVYFVLLVIEKATAFGKFINKRKIFGHVYTLLAVMLLWVVFRADSISQAKQYILIMFGLGGAELFSQITIVYLKENMLYLVASLLLASTMHSFIKNKCVEMVNKRKNQILIMSGELILFLLFSISIVYVINGTYNPFIYFHF